MGIGLVGLSGGSVSDSAIEGKVERFRSIKKEEEVVVTVEMGGSDGRDISVDETGHVSKAEVSTYLMTQPRNEKGCGIGHRAVEAK